VGARWLCGASGGDVLPLLGLLLVSASLAEHTCPALASLHLTWPSLSLAFSRLGSPILWTTDMQSAHHPLASPCLTCTSPQPLSSCLLHPTVDVLPSYPTTYQLMSYFWRTAVRPHPYGTQCLMPTPYYSLLTTAYCLLPIYYPVDIAPTSTNYTTSTCDSLLTAHSRLLTAHYLRLNTYCPLRTARC